MSASKNAYQGLGSVLARLSDITSLKSDCGNEITKEEQDALCHSLTVSVSQLIRAGRIFEFDDDEIDGCAAEFALELTRFVASLQIECEQMPTIIELFSIDQELALDPAPKADTPRTDANGCVRCQDESNVTELFAKGRP